MKDFGLYIHWPFCIKKCPYCDFNSYAFEYDPKIWVEALLNELELASIAFNNTKSSKTALFKPIQAQEMHQNSKTNENHLQKISSSKNEENTANKVDFNNFFDKIVSRETFQNAQKWKMQTIFFGGGTPSLIAPKDIGRIITKAKELFEHDENLEITLEINPSSIETHDLADFLENGINRFSIGVQSLKNENLKFLGRIHSAEEAVKILTQASKICDNVSGDFMYALPTDSLEIWRHDLDRILTLAEKINLKHLSLYQLTIEPNTAFEKAVREKIWSPMDEDAQSHLYEHTFNTLAAADWDFYEISNAAKKTPQKNSETNFEKTAQILEKKNVKFLKKTDKIVSRETFSYRSRHNLIYWNYKNYLGIGAGAHSRMEKDGQKLKFNNVKSPRKWLEKVFEQKTKTPENLENFLEDFLSQKEEVEILDDFTAFQEKILMNLRLTDGVKITKKELQNFNLAKFNLLIREKFIEISENENDMILRLPLKGRLKLDAILRLLFE